MGLSCHLLMVAAAFKASLLAGIFLSKSSNYRYINNGSTWTVTNSTTEAGTDTLKSIEIIQDIINESMGLDAIFDDKRVLAMLIAGWTCTI
jgi:hypothetical protein